MQRKKLAVITAVAGAHRVCPVCGTRSYSRGGIHPQCAQQRADAKRMERVKAKRKTETREPATPSLVVRSWHKLCPRCKAELHVRKLSCACGYEFPVRKHA